MSSIKRFQIPVWLLSVMLCMVIAATPALADYYQSDESGGASPPATIDSITVSSEEVEIPAGSLDSFFDLILSTFEETDALTPSGNLTLVDDILQSDNYASVEGVENEQKNKEFLTVQSKNGNYFYLIIDRSSGTENVYFLNLVDEADLMALMDGDTKEPEPTALTCTCKDKCYTGHVDTSCALCAVNLTACQGKEEVKETPKPEATPEPQSETQNPHKEKSKTGSIVAILLVLALGGGGAFYFLKIKGKNKPQTKGKDDLDDYDYVQGDDDEEQEQEMETEEESE